MKANSEKNLNMINNYQSLEDSIDYQEYYLLSNNSIHRIVILLNINEIIIKCKNYIKTLNINNIKVLGGLEFNTLVESYQFLINKFDENKVELKDILLNKEITIKINNGVNENNNNSNKVIIISLKYDINQKDYIINKINLLNSEINNLKNEVKHLKKENEKFKKEINLLKNLKNKYDNNNLKLLSNITSDSYTDFDLNNTFTMFKSIDDIYYLIYSLYNNSIISYNLDKQQKITEIKSGHRKFISNFRHYLDKINKRDLIISISAEDNNLKIWEIKYWKCLLNIDNINNDGYLDSACLLNNNYNNYIITSNSKKNGISEKIKIYDFNGVKIKEIGYSNDRTFFIDTFYEKRLGINFILTGNEGCVKSYDFSHNKLYHN
jgi:prefoldin subunit 5